MQKGDDRIGDGEANYEESWDAFLRQGVLSVGIAGAFEHKTSSTCHLHTEDLNQNECKSQQQRLRD